MRILGCVPVYRDSPLDALWLELAKTHEVQLWGAGRDAYVPHLPLGQVQRRLGGEPYDLVLAADPGRKGSEPWDFAGVDAHHCAAIVQDAYRGVATFASWANRHRLDLLLVRGRDDLPAVQRACPGIRCEWLPFGVDPDVFTNYGEEERFDVGIFGHRGGVYPVRERARRVLAAQPELTVLDATLEGRASPRVVGADYARAVASCRMAIATCGVPRYVHMKYYEIPACGTALVANRPAHGFERLFAPGVHLRLFRDDGSDLLPLLRELLAGPAALERLTDQGRRHVLGHHTNAHRARQLEELVARLP